MPRPSWAAVCEEMAELKQRDKRMLRLQQVFAAKTTEFREALSAILGVKLAFYDNGQVRVTLQYDLGAASVFQPAPSGMFLWMHTQSACTSHSIGVHACTLGPIRRPVLERGGRII